MLEKSVLTNKELERELKRRYGFKKIIDISKILKASANIFKIKCDDEYYILKEYESSYDLKEILLEERITAILKEKGIPVTDFVSCLNGESVWKYNERVFTLQRFLEGRVIDSHNGSSEAIIESANYLSKINLILKDTDLGKEKNISDWLAPENLLKTNQKYIKIIEECDKFGEDSTFKKIKEDILIKKNLLTELLENKEIIDSLAKVTHMNSHGDYSVLQFIYEQDKSKIKAILDLSVAVKLPIVWEVIRSYSYIDPKCKKGQINVNNLIAYVKEYMKGVQLSKIDLAMMPYVYLIQLLNSSFGYSEYVLYNSENKEQLIKFAFWRTEMCKWLASNAKKLSEELILLDKSE